MINNTDSISDHVYLILMDWRRTQDTDGELNFDSQASSIIKIHVTVCHSTIDIVCKIKVRYIVHNTDRVGKKIDAYCQYYWFSIIDHVGSLKYK